METHGSTLQTLSLTGKKNTTLFEWFWMGCPHTVYLFVRPADPPDEKRISQADFYSPIPSILPVSAAGLLRASRIAQADFERPSPFESR
jgi:hypothetical protein